jgi:hypothetical protein
VKFKCPNCGKILEFHRIYGIRWYAVCDNDCGFDIRVIAESEDDPVFQKALALVDGFEKNEK